MTERDKHICLDLYRHHVLTAHQLAELHFSQPRKARKRLLELHERGILNRFQPRRETGSAPFHYVLAELGALVVAGYYDLDLKHIKRRLVEDQKLAYSAKLTHLLACHDFFIALIAASRDRRHHRLTRWWSEKRCALEWSEHDVRPDGHGILQTTHARCAFLLELDRGTERGTRLTERMRTYKHLAFLNELQARTPERPPLDVLLFLFPSSQRELSARRRLSAYKGLPVATSHRQTHHGDPLGNNWAPLGFSDERRVPLSELGTLRGHAKAIDE